MKDVRFRATQSTAVRAPNIVELFAPQSRNFTTAAIDPCDKDVFRGATAAQQAARRVTCAAAIPGYNPLTFVSNIGTAARRSPCCKAATPTSVRKRPTPGITASWFSRIGCPACRSRWTTSSTT